MSPESAFKALASLNHKRALKLYRAQNGIWLWIGVACIVSALQFWLSPEQVGKTAIGRRLEGGVDDAWNLGVMIGGVMIIWGVWTYRPRAEIIGHLFLTAAMTANALAVLTVVRAGLSAGLLIAVAVASGFRIYFLVATTPRKERGTDDGG